MVTLKSGSAEALSLARSWHDCRRFENLGIPCPYNVAGIEEVDDRTERSVPPELEPSLRPSTKPILPFRAYRRRKPRDTGKDKPADRGTGTGLPTEPIQGAFPIPVRPPQLPLPGFPLPVPLPPPDEGPVPRPGPLPGQPGLPQFPGQPALPGVGSLPRLPDGLGILPVDRPQQLGAFIGEENMTPNLGEVYAQWIPRALNKSFQNIPDIWTPPLPGKQASRQPSIDELLETGLLQDYVRAASFAEETLVQQMSTAPEPSPNSERSRATDFVTSSTPYGARAVAAAGLAATGGLAAAIFKSMRGGGGGIGFQNRGATYRLQNPGFAR